MNDNKTASTNSGEQETDERKTAAAVPPGAPAGTELVGGYDNVRARLRDKGLHQAGFKAQLVEKFRGMTDMPILYMDGKAHRDRRKATAHFFSERAVQQRYEPLMAKVSDRLIGEFRRTGKASLDQLSLSLAVEVASEIIGLTNSDYRAMTRRFEKIFAIGSTRNGKRPALLSQFLKGQLQTLFFHWYDVRPAIAARKAAPQEDLISHLIQEGKPVRQILAECITFGAAGMVTTREFITVAGWHLLEKPELKAAFLDGDRAARMAILEEILRLEPVVGQLFRRDGNGNICLLDIRSANSDPEAFGECPHMLKPGRPLPARVAAHGLSFGDGGHRCPGSGVALAETEIFLDKLLRVPGLAIRSLPDLQWNELVAGYELRHFEIGCDPG